MASVDYFLKLEGVDGESFDSKFKGAIDVQSFSWGVSQAGSFSQGGGGGAGKASFQDFHFVKRLDKSSPVLFQHCASGKHIAKAVFTARKAGGDAIEYLKITFTDCLVSSYSNSPSGDVFPSDSIGLNFAKIEVEYSPQAATGSKEGNVTKGWNIKENKAV